MISSFVAVVFAVVLWAVGALAYDLPHQLGSISEASYAASNAARAGGQAVSVSSSRSGTRTLNELEAIAKAQDYLRANGYTGEVSVAGDTVTVTVALTVPTRFVPGDHRISATETAQAQSTNGGTP